MTPIPTVLPQLPTQNQHVILPRFIAMARSAWQWIERRRVQQTSARRLRVAETVSLGDKRFVSIVKVDGEEMLIGVSGASVSLLTVLKPKSTHTAQQLAGVEENS